MHVRGCGGRRPSASRQPTPDQRALVAPANAVLTDETTREHAGISQRA